MRTIYNCLVSEAVTVHYDHGRVTIPGLCVGSTLAWIRDVRRGREMADTLPNLTTARHISVAYASGFGGANNNDIDPNDLSRGLFLADLRYYGVAIRGLE
jgi:hypothetical protein